jgi:hypothetical protein
MTWVMLTQRFEGGFEEAFNQVKSAQVKALMKPEGLVLRRQFTEA